MFLPLATLALAGAWAAAVWKAKTAAPSIASGPDAGHLGSNDLSGPPAPPPLLRPPQTAPPVDSGGALSDLGTAVKDAKTVAGVASTVGTVAGVAGVDVSGAAVVSAVPAVAAVAVPLAAGGIIIGAILSDILGPTDAQRWAAAEHVAETSCATTPGGCVQADTRVLSGPLNSTGVSHVVNL